MVIFLLQCLAPAFQGVMAKSVDGFTDTYCTMYGTVTVFIEFEDEQTTDVPKCYECAACAFQTNLNAQPVTHVFQLEARYLPDLGRAAGALYQVANPPPYSPFLSRAPPA